MRIIITSIPLTCTLAPTTYKSQDASIPSTDMKTVFPIMPYLDATIKENEEIKIVIISKLPGYDASEKNLEQFMKEIDAITAPRNARVTFAHISSEFNENIDTHQGLMNEIVKEIPDNSDVLCDITYGPKDLPLVVTSAIKFATKFLNCNLEKILYGLGYFTKDGKFVKATLTDLSPLQALTDLIQSIPASDPDTARELLNNIVSL